MARPVSRYCLLYLEDPLRSERLNVAVIAWADAGEELYWRFIDDAVVLTALHLSPASIKVLVSQFHVFSQMWTKAHLFKEMHEERGPHSWIGFSKPSASYVPPDVLAADIYRILLTRPEVPVISSTQQSEEQPEVVAEGDDRRRQW